MKKLPTPKERHRGAWVVTVHAPDASSVYMYERPRSKTKLPWTIIVPWGETVDDIQTFISLDGNDLKIVAIMQGARELVGLDIQFLGVTTGEEKIPHIVDLMGNQLQAAEGPLDPAMLMLGDNDTPTQ